MPSSLEVSWSKFCIHLCFPIRATRAAHLFTSWVGRLTTFVSHYEKPLSKTDVLQSHVTSHLSGPNILLTLLTLYPYTLYLNQGCTNLGRQVAMATKFCTVAPNICGALVWNFFHFRVTIYPARKENIIHISAIKWGHQWKGRLKWGHTNRHNFIKYRSLSMFLCWWSFSFHGYEILSKTFFKHIFHWVYIIQNFCARRSEGQLLNSHAFMFWHRQW